MTQSDGYQNLGKRAARKALAAETAAREAKERESREAPTGELESLVGKYHFLKNVLGSKPTEDELYRFLAYLQITGKDPLQAIGFCNLLKAKREGIVPTELSAIKSEQS